MSKLFGPYDTNMILQINLALTPCKLQLLKNLQWSTKKKEIGTVIYVPISLESTNLWNAFDTFRKVITVLLIELDNSNH